MIERLGPLEQATIDVPVRWYEKSMDPGNISKPIILVGTTFGSLPAWEYLSSISQSVLPNVVGGFIYLISAVGDRISTVKGLRDMKKAEMNGVISKHEETNPHLKPAIEQGENLYLVPKANAIQLTLTSVAFLWPNVGTAATLLKLNATVSNLRLSKRYRRATEITKSNS